MNTISTDISFASALVTIPASHRSRIDHKWHQFHKGLSYASWSQVVIICQKVLLILVRTVPPTFTMEILVLLESMMSSFRETPIFSQVVTESFWFDLYPVSQHM